MTTQAVDKQPVEPEAKEVDNSIEGLSAEDLQGIVKKLRAENAKRRTDGKGKSDTITELKKQIADREKAEATKQAEALIEQKNFKELSEAQALELKELREANEKYLEQAESFTAQNEYFENLASEQAKDLSEDIIELLEGKSALQKLEWIKKYRAKKDEFPADGLNAKPSNKMSEEDILENMKKPKFALDLKKENPELFKKLVEKKLNKG